MRLHLAVGLGVLLLTAASISAVPGDRSPDGVSLWAPNHSMQPIVATVQVPENCPGVSFALTSVASSEPDNGLGDGDTTGDIQDAALGTPDTDISLRAERQGGNDGRGSTR